MVGPGLEEVAVTFSGNPSRGYRATGGVRHR